MPRRERPRRFLDHPSVPVVDEIAPADTMFNSDAPENYFVYGPSALASIELTMMGVGKNTLTNILDLPSGYGRVLRTLAAAFPEAQLTACDIDRDAVDFCGRIFGARVVYASDELGEVRLGGAYDLIWVGSLFTHLDADRCAAFLTFLADKLAPQGLLVFTTHGRWIADRGMGRERRWFGMPKDHLRSALESFHEVGFGYVDYPGKQGYGISLSSPAWVASAVTAVRGLRLVGLTERGWVGRHDIVSCQMGAAGPAGAWFPDP